MPQPTLPAERRVLLGVVVAAAVALLPGALDPVTLPKLTVVAVGTMAVVALAAGGALAARRLVVPSAPVLWAALAFGAAAVVAAVRAEAPWIAVVGQYRRGSGLALYLACIVLLAVTLRAFDRTTVHRVAVAFLAAGGVVAGYGAVQAAGLDPGRWEVLYGGVSSTLGNPNFAAAYLGMIVPLAVWGALRTSWTTAWRVSSGVLAAGAFGVAVATQSVQGPLVVVLGTAVVALTWTLAAEGTLRRVAVTVWAAAAAGGGALVAAALAGAGPLARLAGRGTVELRLWYWQAAVDMLADHPVAGVGLDMYAGYFRAYRPAGALAHLGPHYDVDAPHNVVLGMFANGGVLLGGAYLAVVAVTAWALVDGFRRLRGDDLLLLGGLGGAWLAYQAQSLISIDVPTLAVAHWVLAGAIVVLARPPALHAFGRPPPGRGRRRRRPQGTPAATIGYGAVAVVTAVALWATLLPLRADYVAGQGRRLLALGDGDGAIAAYDTALRRVPWQAEYWAGRGEVFGEAGLLDEAASSYRAAVAHDPRNLPLVMTAARLAHGTGDVTAAAALYQRAVAVESASPILAEAAEFWLATGDPGRAAALAETAVADGGQAEWWALLGHARAATGRPDEARVAYQRALALEPDLDEARLGLDRLGGDP